MQEQDNAKVKCKKIFQLEDKFFNAYFDTIEQGKEIFQPWGNAGEAYLVNADEKQNIIKYASYILWGLIVFAFFLGVFVPLPIHSRVLIIINIIFFANGISVYFITRNLAPYASADKNDSKAKKTKALQQLCIILLCQIFMVFMGMPLSPDDVLLWKFGPVSVVINLTLLLLFWLKKGYVFQNKPAFND